MKPDNRTYELELLIAKFLRWGVFFCGALIFLGWILNLHWDANPFVIYKDYDPIPFWDILQHYISRGNWAGIISYAGLAGLVSLPVWRVFLTGVLFLRQKERGLAVIAFVVFTLLVISFLLGVNAD
jgi:uncharacterized membrane protein